MKPLRRADGTLETGLIRHHMDPWDTGDPRIDRYDDQDTATSDMLALLDEVDAMRNRIADLERDLEKNKAASGRARFRARVLGRAVSEAHQALDRRRVWSCQARLEAAGIVHTILVDVLDEAAQALGGARPSEEPAPDTGVVGTWRKRSIDVQAAQLTGETAHDHAVYQWVEALTLGSFEPLEVLEGRAPVPASGISIDPATGQVLIATLEGLMHAPLGWCTLRGVAGAFYPCDPAVFAATYGREPR